MFSSTSFWISLFFLSPSPLTPVSSSSSSPSSLWAVFFLLPTTNTLCFQIPPPTDAWFMLQGTCFLSFKGSRVAMIWLFKQICVSSARVIKGRTHTADVRRSQQLRSRVNIQRRVRKLWSKGFWGWRSFFLFMLLFTFEYFIIYHHQKREANNSILLDFCAFLCFCILGDFFPFLLSVSSVSSFLSSPLP